MKVLMIKPGKRPKEIVLDQTLKAMQKVVGGYIQAIYPFEEPVAIVCNEEAKLQNLPLNRALYSPDNGECYDVVAGTFFLCSAPTDSDCFESLSDEQIARYQARFQYPEEFLKVNNTLVCISVEEESDD